LTFNKGFAEQVMGRIVTPGKLASSDVGMKKPERDEPKPFVSFFSL